MISAVKGRAIIEQKSTNYDTIIDQIKGVKHATPKATYPEMILSLQNKEVDGITAELPVAEGAVAEGFANHRAAKAEHRADSVHHYKCPEKVCSAGIRRMDMKRMIILIAVIFLLLGMTGCGNSNSTGIPYNTSADPAQQDNPENHKAVEKNDIQQTEQNESGPTDKEENNTMKISVKSANYEMIYELNNSQAAKALYAQLPLTMEVKPFQQQWKMTFFILRRSWIHRVPR